MAAYFVFCLLLLPSVLQAKDEPEDSRIRLSSLHNFLERAHTLGIITDRQELELKSLADDFGGGAPEREGESYEDESYSRVFSSVFLQTYNQFTLLNVLYFSGALLIIGAYTLFSTLAWVNFGHGGVGLMLLIPVLLCGGLGIHLWDGGNFQILGGL